MGGSHGKYKHRKKKYDVTTSEIKSVNTTTSEIKSVNTATSEIKSVNTATSEIKSVNTATSEIKSVNTATSEIKSVNTATSEIKSVNTATSEIKSVNTATSEFKSFNTDLPEPELSDEEVTMLKEMWTTVNQHVAKVGTVLFVDLFETHPEVEEVFMSFRVNSSSEQEYQQIIRAHALRVMGTVDKCLYRLNNRQKLRDLMFNLGTRHRNYFMKTDQIELMGPQFIASIKPHLENVRTKEHEQAWENLFKLLCYHMRTGLRNTDNEQ